LRDDLATSSGETIMTLQTNDGFAKHELSTDELDAVSGGFFNPNAPRGHGPVVLPGPHWFPLPHAPLPYPIHPTR
jgi:hypothetical protein